MAAPEYTLLYFPIPGAPGEVVRVTLVVCGIEFEDKGTSGVEWGGINQTTMFGQMPVLKAADGSLELAQSKAIVRFLAKTSKTPAGAALYPADARQAVLVDMMMDTLDEIRTHLVPTFSIQDQAEKEAARAALFAEGGKILEGLKKVERQIATADGYIVGGTLSLADLTAFAVVNQVRAGFMDGAPTDGWIDKLPKLKAVVAQVAAVPVINAYYAKKAESNKLFAPHAGLK